jgi:hypothetical protein
MPRSFRTTEPAIADPRKHSEETVRCLQQLLAGGVAGKPDPKRPDFYELESGARVFYVHISPVTGSVTLLATWTTDEAPLLPELRHAAAVCGEAQCAC